MNTDGAQLIAAAGGVGQTREQAHANYRAEYARLQADVDAFSTAAWVLTGAGAALAVTGGVLLALDEGSDVAPDRATVTPMWVPGGGGLQIRLGF